MTALRHLTTILALAGEIHVKAIAQVCQEADRALAHKPSQCLETLTTAVPLPQAANWLLAPVSDLLIR